MPPAVRNRRHPRELTEADVRAALGRIRERDQDVAREAEHVYDTLTQEEGPAVLRQRVVQDWVWYRLTTKYFGEEPGHAQRLAEAAAVLFEELGLDAHAAVCRSEVTARVHAAFERSDHDGFVALRKAVAGSGIDAPDLDDFVWGEVMGVDEEAARSAVENGLEAAIEAGDLVVGGRGWRTRQSEIAAAVLDADRPGEPGRSWRTAVLAERIGGWVHFASSRCERAGRRRAELAERLLEPVEPPSDVAEHMAPVAWLLDVFGDEQPLTETGKLNRAFVLQVYDTHPWPDEPRFRTRPRSETDVFVLLVLREWLQEAGALRRRGKVLRRTERGQAMAHDPVALWTAYTQSPAAAGWDRFVFDSALEMLLVRGGPVPVGVLLDEIAGDAADIGWSITTGGVREPPGPQGVSHAFQPAFALFERFGFGADVGESPRRAVRLTPAGESTALAILRATATGPRKRWW